jgi:hypothetical protein
VPKWDENKLPIVAFAYSGVPKAALFRHALIADLRRSGSSFGRKFRDPHMTVFYDFRFVAEEPIDAIHWVIRDFVLVHDIYGEARHELLGQWSLRD